MKLFRNFITRCVIFSLVLLSAPGWGAPTYGVELTLTKHSLYTADNGATGEDVWTPEGQEALERYAKLLKQVCEVRKNCQVIWSEDKFGFDAVEVKYTDIDFSFEVTLDPGVLEIIPKPMTLRQFKKAAPRIQQDIFDLGKMNGLFPSWRWGGSHVHLGADSAFGSDVKLLRNWLVDFSNHVELATGAMENDDTNASAMFRMNPQQKKRLQDLIAKVDSGKIRSIRRFATEFEEEVLLVGKSYTAEEFTLTRYWSMNFTRLSGMNFSGESNYTTDALAELSEGARTVEMRAVRTFINSSEMIRVLELFEARLKYIRNLDKPLALSPAFFNNRVPTVAERTKAFWEYISEAGLNPADYEFLMPDPEWLALFRKAGHCDEELARAGKRPNS